MRLGSKLIFVTLALLAGALGVRAATVGELQDQINSHNEAIRQLETEIAEYQRALTATQSRTTTLAGELGRLDTTRKKLATDLQLTQQKINTTSLQLNKLSLEIDERGEHIVANRQRIAEILRTLRGQDDSLLELALTDASLASVWQAGERLDNLQAQVVERVADLQLQKSELEAKEAETERQRARLQALGSQLGDQKKLVDQNRQNTNQLLAQTKNQEASYRQLIAQKEARKATFERELFEFESRLQGEVDASRLPGRGAIFRWPLDNVFITQLFGRTQAAARLYVSGSHNGVDLRAAVGTPVLAVGSGVVAGAGDTDLVCRGASYGKWVMIDHHNGLSTIYGHLSLVRVRAGESVTPGALIAYSGGTGYATGPHVHLSVVATEPTHVGQLPSRSCPGAIFTIPLVPAQAYLDPMLYLPTV